MAIAVPLSLLVALTYLGKVNGFLEHELGSEIQSQGIDALNITQENHVGIRESKGECKNIGGKCINHKEDCPIGFSLETQTGGPYCSKLNRCCYPGCVYGLKAYPNNAIIKQDCFELQCEMGYWIINSDDCLESFLSKSFLVTVKTGHGLNAGADSNVHIELEDHNGKSTKKFQISHPSRSLLKRGGNSEHRVPIPKGFGKTTTIKITLESKDRTIKDWFCDDVYVEDPRTNETLYFPIHRRIESNLKYEFRMDTKCQIPKYGPSISTKLEFEFDYSFIAAMVKTLPRDEYFGCEYLAGFLNQSTQAEQSLLPLYIEWNKTGNIMVIYCEYFPLPESFQFWREDAWFGAQRVQGILPNIIELCSNIPDKFGVTEDTVNGLLEGSTLQQALKNNKIFITDLSLLEGIEYKDNNRLDHASPIALFYLNNLNRLMPIAIQLWQKKGQNNPVYTPKDPPITWLVAKMYYNNAEAQLHQVVHHFGYTHLMMDGVAASMNRQLAPEHPVYKLLKPHFLFMMAINKVAEDKLLNPGGKLDLFSIGTAGVKKLLAKAVPLFTFERAIGSVESDAKARGVWDKEILPQYPFRDDASDIYDITKKYVTTILKNCYRTPKSVRKDKYLQNFRKELSKSRDQDGVGIPGLPGSNTTGFSNIIEVIDMVTMIIVQCSVGHAAVNFPQYETYGWMPNYPADINKPPSTRKGNYTEADMMGLLPDKITYLGIMGIAKLLSWDGTNELGDYEKVYFPDPVGIAALAEFKKNLKDLSTKIQMRNTRMAYPYKYLDPEYVPNAISI